MARKPSKSPGLKRYPPTSTGESVDKQESRAPAEKPISLRPLEFEEAVKGLLRVGREGNKITPTKAKPGTEDGR